MPKIITIANQKGGVGKTTTAVNLSTAIAASGLKVLVIDLDSQGNASTGFGIEQGARANSSYDIFTSRKNLIELIYSTEVQGLDIIPATLDLSAIDIELSQFNGREFLIKKALQKFQELDNYDYIIFDTPPSLNLLTVNALAASESVLIPLQCEFFALEGLAHLLNTVKLVKESLNNRLKISGILLTMYDRRNKLTYEVERDVRDNLGNLVYKTHIPRNVKLPEAPSFGKPVLLYDVNCAGSVAYIEFAREFLDREGYSNTKEEVA